MVSRATKILDSGYTIALAKSYSGRNAQHWYWAVYPDDTDWYHSDKHGNLPRTHACYFSFRKESSRSPVTPSIHKCSFVSKFTGRRYHVSITNGWAKSFTVSDICEGVVCDDVCINADKYSQTCVGEGENAGECTFDQLIKANSPDCPGYDPCEGVACEDVCDGTDLYESVCEGGACVRGTLIETSSVECGYVPHVCNEGELRSPTTCEDGSVIYGEMCSNNAWVPTGYTCEDAPAPKPDNEWITYLFIGLGIILLYQILGRA